MPRLNTTLPDSYGLSLTVWCPTASEANPIDTGDILSWSATEGYGAVPAVAGDPIQIRVKEPCTDPLTPVGAHIYGFSRVERLPFLAGAAPALGASVEADGAGNVRTAVAPNGTRVVYVDTAAGLVDVLLP
jgi:hypothetical protein